MQEMVVEYISKKRGWHKIAKLVVEYISKKKGWHKIAKLVNRDRKSGHQFSIHFFLNILLKVSASV